MGNAAGSPVVDGDDYDPSVRSRSDADPDSFRGRRARSVDPVEASPPESPGRSLTPLVFAPQIPVPPLQAASNATSTHNKTLINEYDQPMDCSMEKGIPTLITWNRGGDSVQIEGSWDNWMTRKFLHKSGKDHAILLVLPSGVYLYKFIVDGQQGYIHDLPFVADNMGNITNLLDVHEYVPENTQGVSDFDSPSSPESSYSWSSPKGEDFAKEPPGVPSQLHLTILDKDNSDETSAKPPHVVLNHLFIEKGCSSQSMVALGLTHRFQSKYVTVVLYKPVRR